MTEQNNIIVVFNEKAELFFVDLIKKYNIEESEEKELKDLLEKRVPLGIMVKKIIRAFAGKIITQEDFINSLKRVLDQEEQIIKTISQDITDNLIPLLDKIPEDQLKEYNQKKSDLERKNRYLQEKDNEQVEDLEAAKKEAFAKAKEELFRKIGVDANKPEPQEEPENPYDKKIDITNVEENAQTMEGTKKQVKEEPVQPASPPQEVKVDPYKEQIE